MCTTVVFAFAAMFLGQLPTIEVDGFAPDVQNAALLATVRILNNSKNTLASGVILERSGPITYILTAAHVVDDSDNVEVHVLSSKTYPKEAQRFKSVAVIARSANKQPDLALLRMVGYDGEAKGLKICPLGKLPKQKEFKAISVGCAQFHALTLLRETVLDVVRAKKPGDAKTCVYFRTEQKPGIGRSGGPLVDSGGRLLAICSGADNGRGFYCHLEDLHQFLIANGLRSLLSEKP